MIRLIFAILFIPFQIVKFMLYITGVFIAIVLFGLLIVPAALLFMFGRLLGFAFLCAGFIFLISSFRRLFRLV